MAKSASRKRWGVMAAAVAAWSLVAFPAAAQLLREALPTNEPPGGLRDMPQSQQSQFTKEHPGYEQEGIKAGGFVVKPRLTTGATITDNVYARPADKAKGDVIGSVEPDLRLASNWSRHEISARAQGEFQRFMNESGENANNFNFSGGGRVDIDSENSLNFSAGHKQTHERRGDPDAIDTLRPTLYRENSLGAGIRHAGGRWTIGLNGRVANLNYDDEPKRDGTVLPSSLRNRDVYNVNLRTGFDVGAGTVLFVEARSQIGAYDKERTASTYDRDYHAVTTGGGVAYNFGERVSGELFFGAMNRNVDDTRLNDVATYVYSAHILYNVTQLTSLRAMAYRSFNEIQVGPTPGYYNTHFWAGVEHELQRNVVVNANVGRRFMNYEQVDNQVRQWSLGAGATWLINPNLRAQLEYNHTISDNSAPDADYARNQGALRLTAQF